jgi:hypothetical protein
MRAPYTEGNSPEDNASKPIREKKISVIGFKKHKPPEYHPHCVNHIWQRLLRVNDSFLCPAFGPSVPSIRIMETETETE